MTEIVAILIVLPLVFLVMVRCVQLRYFTKQTNLDK